MNKDEIKKKEKRRQRNDPQNRNYVCGCGKSYLSYPALYTHQKAKHGKEKPPGTKTPIVNGTGHRGRPKVFNNSKYLMKNLFFIFRKKTLIQLEKNFEKNRLKLKVVSCQMMVWMNSYIF